MTAYEALHPPLESGISASAAGLQSALLMLLRESTLKRFARLLQGWHNQQLRLAMLRWHRAAQYMEWLQRRDFVQQKTSDSQRVLSEEQAREVRELRRRWRAEREALVRERGYAQEGSQTVALPLDDHEELKRLDKHWRQQLQELHQGHLDSTEYFEATCQKLHGECHVNLKAMVLLAFSPPHGGRHSRSGRERLWALEDIDPGVLQWAFTRPPDPCMVPFPQTCALEEQRQPLASTAKLLLDYMEKLPNWALLASSKRGQRAPMRHPPPRLAGHLMKSVLRRVQARVLRAAMDELSALAPRSMRAADGTRSHPFAEFSLGRKAWKRVRKAIPRIKALKDDGSLLEEGTPDAVALEQRKVRIERPRRLSDVSRPRAQTEGDPLRISPKSKKKHQTLPPALLHQAAQHVDSEEMMRQYADSEEMTRHVTYSFMEEVAKARSRAETEESLKADWPFMLGEDIVPLQPRRRASRVDTRQSSKSLASHSPRNEIGRSHSYSSGRMSPRHSFADENMSPRACAEDQHLRVMSARSAGSSSARRHTSPHATPRTRFNDSPKRASAFVNSSSLSTVDVSPDLLAWAGDTPSAAAGRSPSFQATPSLGQAVHVGHKDPHAPAPPDHLPRKPDYFEPHWRSEAKPATSSADDGDATPGSRGDVTPGSRGDVTPNSVADSQHRFPMTTASTVGSHNRNSVAYWAEEGQPTLPFMTTASTVGSHNRNYVAYWGEGSLVMSALPDIPDIPSSPTALADISTSSTATPAVGEFEVPAPLVARSPSKDLHEERRKSSTRTSPPGALTGPTTNGAAPLEVLVDDRASVMPAPRHSQAMSMPALPPSHIQQWPAADREAALLEPPALADDTTHQSVVPVTRSSSEGTERRPSLQSQLSRPQRRSQNALGFEAGPDVTRALESVASQMTAQVPSQEQAEHEEEEEEEEDQAEQEVEEEEEQGYHEDEEEEEDSGIDDDEELELPLELEV